MKSDSSQKNEQWVMGYCAACNWNLWHFRKRVKVWKFWTKSIYFCERCKVKSNSLAKSVDGVATASKEFKPKPIE